MRKRLEWKQPSDLRFRTTDYVVEATHDESHLLWADYHLIRGVKFDQDSMGYWYTIGSVGDMPVAVSVYWHVIEDLFRVAFVEATSLIVDYEMVQDWQRVAFSCLQRPDGWRERHTNVANFSGIIGDMARRLGREVVKRDIFEVERFLNKNMPIK